VVPSTFVAIVIALGLTNVTSEERNRFIISHALPWPIRYTFRLKTRGMDAIEGGGWLQQPCGNNDEKEGNEEREGN